MLDAKRLGSERGERGLMVDIHTQQLLPCANCVYQGAGQRAPSVNQGDDGTVRHT